MTYNASRPYRDLAGYRVLAVHAHPDDESITMGGTLFELARRGADVTVVTCTLGEQGEVIGAPYQHLVADRSDQLGGFRIGELRAALDILGVAGEHLVAPGYFRDSGMVGDPAHEHPRAFAQATEEPIEALAEVYRRLRPHLVLTYGPDGGYGHPDHIHTHEIVHAAAESVPVPRIAWSVVRDEDLAAGLSAIASPPQGWRMPAAGELPSVAHADVDVRLPAAAWWVKKEAMRAHATQLWIADGSTSLTNPQAAVAAVRDTRAARGVYALSNLIAQPLIDVESYQWGAGVQWDAARAGGVEVLLDGLER